MQRVDAYRPLGATTAHRLLAPAGGVLYTEKGLAMMPPNSTLQLTANAALLSVLWGKKKAANPLDNNCWARKQIAYMLGDSGQSFVVGFGKAPEKVPHRAASCPEPGDEICTWQTGYLSSDPNPHLLYGALVGGPTKDDGFYDDRRAAAGSCWRLLALPRACL